MAERSHEEVERDAKDTDELLYTDLSDNIRGFGLDHLPLKPDHCDLLLDAIDAQLGQLQVQPQKHPALSRGCDCSNAAPLGWSRCPSKDTGLGSTKQTNDTPTSCLDLIHTQRIGQKSERSTSCQEHTAMHVETKMRSEKEIESRREQVIWRLERLLGDTCNKDGIAGEMHPPSESICTEDFVRRFREEMVELAFPENNTQLLDKEKESEKTEVSDSDTYYNVPAVETAYYSQANTPDQRNEPYFSEKAGAGEKYQSSQRADAGNTSHKTEVVTEPERLQHNNSHSPKSRCLPGVHVRRFDSVSIDSDLDSVCTEQSRQHIHRQSGWHALIRSVTGIDGNCTDQSGCDTPAQEESGPPSTSVQRHTHGNLQNRSPSAHKAQSIKRKTYRLVYSLDENDQNGNEKMNHWTRRCRSQRTSEKMQLDRAKLKERLFNLQQKCEREEEALRLKRTQLKGVELSLSELQQKRKYTLQELEQLTAETAQMEKKKRILETFLSDSQAEKDSISCQLEKLQRKRESCLLEVRNMEEELATLSQRKAALKDRSYMEKNSVVMSVLEREEMERQLDSSKTALFAEQRRAREKLEFMQEKLEETHEELHRATEAENTLRNRCVWLEEKQMQKKMEIEALEVQVSKLQAELGESKIRVGTLEKIFAQKERQLIDFQEHRKASQAERDGLKQELQHLKSQLYKSVEEAQEQAHRMMLKEDEVKQLRKSLEQQKEEANNRQEELHVDALERVHKAIEEERRKWEAEKVEAVQVQRGILEEQNRKSLESMRSEMQQEKSKALAIQHKLMELKTRVQELESERCAQQREQESLLAVTCKSLKEGHQAELQRLERQIGQESQRTVLQLERAVQLAEGEADRLRVMLEERESSHKQVTAELDRQLRHWVQELGAECQHLHLLVEQSGAKQSAVQLPESSTVAEAFTNLRTLREQLMQLINHLHKELDSQKKTTEQLRQDKERELSIQRQQLRIERDQALNFLKMRLIQEHIEELSSMNWAHMSDGVAASLRKQLKTKDAELRQVQRNMGQWKEQTAARPACGFEEDLTAELERKISNTPVERQRKSERSEEHVTLSAKETLHSACSPSLHAASYSPSNVASFKVLHYLQSRVKQLRVENQANNWNPSPPDTVPLDLSGSYLATV